MKFRTKAGLVVEAKKLNNGVPVLAKDGGESALGYANRTGAEKSAAKVGGRARRFSGAAFYVVLEGEFE